MAATQHPASPRVLIAEADPVEREILTRMVREARADARIESAFNGLGALEQLAVFEPDMVIADWDLAGVLGGFDLLRLVRQGINGRPMSFLLSSSRSDAASVRSMLPLAPTAYLTKPLQQDKLRSRLLELLNRPAAIESLFPPDVSLSSYLQKRREDAPGAPVSIDLHAAFKRSFGTKVPDINQLERDLKHDPQVTGLMIAAANAAAQHMGEPVQTLAQALSRLGQAQSLDVLFGLSLQPGLRLTDGRLLEAARPFWALSIRIATYARALARMEGLDAERCFAAGLLHSLGDLTVLRCLQDWLNSSGILEDGDIARALESHAAEFGSALRRRWRLPLELRDLIGVSYQFGGGVHSREALVLHLTGQLARLEEGASLEELAGSKAARLMKVGVYELQRLLDSPVNPALAPFLLPVPR